VDRDSSAAIPGTPRHHTNVVDAALTPSCSATVRAFGDAARGGVGGVVLGEDLGVVLGGD
jgi:hypothetical protein